MNWFKPIQMGGRLVYNGIDQLANMQQIGFKQRQFNKMNEQLQDQHKKTSSLIQQLSNLSKNLQTYKKIDFGELLNKCNIGLKFGIGKIMSYYQKKQFIPAELIERRNKFQETVDQISKNEKDQNISNKCNQQNKVLDLLILGLASSRTQNSLNQDLLQKESNLNLMSKVINLNQSSNQHQDFMSCHIRSVLIGNRYKANNFEQFIGKFFLELGQRMLLPLLVWTSGKNYRQELDKQLRQIRQQLDKIYHQKQQRRQIGRNTLMNSLQILGQIVSIIYAVEFLLQQLRSLNYLSLSLKNQNVLIQNKFQDKEKQNKFQQILICEKELRNMNLWKDDIQITLNKLKSQTNNHGWKQGYKKQIFYKKERKRTYEITSDLRKFFSILERVRQTINHQKNSNALIISVKNLEWIQQNLDLKFSQKVADLFQTVRKLIKDKQKKNIQFEDLINSIIKYYKNSFKKKLSEKEKSQLPEDKVAIVKAIAATVVQYKVEGQNTVTEWEGLKFKDYQSNFLRFSKADEKINEVDFSFLLKDWVKTHTQASIKLLENDMTTKDIKFKKNKIQYLRTFIFPWSKIDSQGEKTKLFYVQTFKVFVEQNSKYHGKEFYVRYNYMSKEKETPTVLYQLFEVQK